jgi:hypothetical protein
MVVYNYIYFVRIRLKCHIIRVPCICIVFLILHFAKLLTEEVGCLCICNQLIGEISSIEENRIYWGSGWI